MRKLVKEKTPEVFLAEEADIDKFYGVVTDLYKNKCFITRPYYKSGRYQLRTLADLTSGNEIIVTTTDPPEMKLPKYLRFIQDRYTTKDIFEFDTGKELMKWLSE